MIEIVFSAPDYDTFLAEAKRLGFTYSDDDGDHVIMSGSIASGGSWLLNIVGDVYVYGTEPDTADKMPGYWGRLIINGQPESMVTFGPSITQYIWDAKKEYWTSDGRTPAPIWVDGVGQIA